MPPSIRQTNFSGGELDPLLWGRTDLPIYARGLRTMRNFVPTRQGAAMSRPGTMFVGGGPADAIVGSDRDVGQRRLIRFDAGDAQFQSYALEFGNLRVRFITQGAYVLDGAGNPYEVATPYSNTEIWELQYAQVGDVLFLCSPERLPQQLRRNGHTDWALSEVRFKAYEPYPTDIDTSASPTTGFNVVVPPAWAAGDYVSGQLVAKGGLVYECIHDGTSAAGPAGTGKSIADGADLRWRYLAVENDPDEDHIAQEWQWLWTARVRDVVSGAEYETRGELVSFQFDGFDYDDSNHMLTSDKWAVSEGMPIILRRADTQLLLNEPDGFDTYEVLEYLIYRGRGGAFGWVGSTKTREFIDLGEAPDYAIQPPHGDEPFNALTGYPRAVAFFQNRLCFAGPTGAPGDFYGSKVGDVQNWDVRLYKHADREAVHFELASRRREEIRSMVVLGKLLMLTNASQWSADGGEGQPLLFDHVETRVEDEIGATTLPPLIVEGAMLYAREKGRGVRALVSQGQQVPFQGVDISEQSLHLFTGKDKRLVDWCYQEDPHGLVWAVREDGALLSLTFMRDRWSWARHDTDGLVESVCSVPEGNEDAVYMVVVRTLGDGKRGRYVERMTSRVQYGGPYLNDDALTFQPADFICVDSGLLYYGAPVQTISGLEHLEGLEVWVIGPNLDPLGTFTVEDGEIDLGDVLPANVNIPGIGPHLWVYVGLRFTPELETLDVAGGDARLKRKTVERIGFEADQSIGLRVGRSLDEDALDDWVQRDADEDGFDAVSAATVLVDVPVEGEWDQSARAALQQSMPLPITVVGLTRELALGE